MKGIKRVLLLSVAVIGILAISGCDGSSNHDSNDDNDSYTPAPPPTNPYEIPPIDEDTKVIFMEEINNARATDRYCGNEYMPAVPPLKWNDKLYKAAYEHSQDMDASGVFSHDGSNTESDWTAQRENLGKPSSSKDRIEAYGYKWKRIAENIYKGSGNLNTIEHAMEAWLNSPGHCKNIMNPKLEEVGMAQVGEYWTQDFGTPRDW